MSPPEGPRRRWRGARLPPPTVLAATVALGALLLQWALLTPVDRAPDELTHADLVFHLAEGRPYPEYDGRNVAEAANTLRLHQGLVAAGGPATAGNAPPRWARPTFDELGGNGESSWVLQNQMPQHPPLYYQAAALVVRAERALAPGPEWSFEREWLLVRLVGAAAIVPLPFLAWLAARRLGASGSLARAAALFPLAVPQLGHVGASVSNDPPLVLLAAILAVPVAGILRGDTSRRTALWAGFVCGVALLVKAFALLLVAWLVLAYATSTWRRADRRRPAARGAAIALLTAFVVGGWWWVGNAVRHGTPTPSIERVKFPEAVGFEPDVAWWLGRAVVWLPERFWGTFDWLTLPMSWWTIVPATLVAAATVAVALAPRGGHRSPPDPPVGRVRLAAFTSVAPLLLGLVLQHAWSLYAWGGRAQFLQGRYLFSALVPLAVVVAAGLVRLVGRWAPVLVLGWASVMVLDGFRVALRGWWAGPGASFLDRMRAAEAWNPAPGGVLWVVLVVAAAAWAGLAAATVVDARRSSTPSAEAVDDGLPTMSRSSIA